MALGRQAAGATTTFRQRVPRSTVRKVPMARAALCAWFLAGVSTLIHDPSHGFRFRLFCCSRS